MEEGEDSKVVIVPKVKKRKVAIGYDSDDCDEEREKSQKKTTFENDSDDAIPGSVSKLNKIVFYKDAGSDS